MSEAKTWRKLHVYWPGELPLSMVDSLNWAGASIQHEDYYDRILSKQVFTRCMDPFHFMEQMWKTARDGALMVVDTPYGSHDSADGLYERRRVWAETFREFEPKWHFQRRVFYCDGLFFDPNTSLEQLGMAVAQLRNVVKGFAVELICQKEVVEGYKADDPITMFKFI